MKSIRLIRLWICYLVCPALCSCPWSLALPSYASAHPCRPLQRTAGLFLWQKSQKYNMTESEKVSRSPDLSALLPPWLLTRLPLLPAVISDVRHVVLLHVFLNLLQLRGLVLGFEVSGHVVVHTQVFSLPFYSLPCRPGGGKVLTVAPHVEGGLQTLMSSSHSHLHTV